jgi:hypothetical protein
LFGLFELFGFLAPIAMESLLKAKPIFSWFAKATAGSSWQTLEKKALLKKLGMKSGK